MVFYITRCVILSDLAVMPNCAYSIDSKTVTDSQYFPVLDVTRCILQIPGADGPHVATTIECLDGEGIPPQQQGGQPSVDKSMLGTYGAYLGRSCAGQGKWIEV